MAPQAMAKLSIVKWCLALLLWAGFSNSIFSQPFPVPNKAGVSPGALPKLQIWSRKYGDYSDDQNPERYNQVEINPVEHGAYRLQTRKLFDAQYGKKYLYRGLSLASIVAAYKPQRDDNLLILHFENGMLIPLSLSDASRLEAFFAIEICEDKGRCEPRFPEISKEDAYFVTSDPRPIVFGWNKVVVNSLWHPDVPKSRTAGFSPWHHMDSLSGIEFVNRAAYYRQFELGQTRGEQVYRERCQYCHAVRFVGSRFGWDFVTPLPIYEKRSPESLLIHVKYPKARARKMGLMMPNQSDVSADDVQAIWRWMKVAAKVKKIPAYRP